MTFLSDKTIKIFEVQEDKMNPTGQEIKAHDGAVWQVSWAHPKFGVLLASASFDSKGNFGPFLRENQFIFFSQER